jgi:hypothetical protein
MKKALIIFLVLGAIVIFLSFLGNKHISNEITINAPVNKVWNTLIDFNKYPEWNPFIRKASGTIKKGEIIEVTFHTKGSDPITFTPKIILLKENDILQWEGRLLMPGIFTGKHTFQLLSIDNNKTQFIQKENFNGILVSFFNFDSTIEGFKLMNGALKKRIENK